MPVENERGPMARGVVGKGGLALCLSLFMAMATAAPASAEIAVSQLIVELKPGASRAADIEIYNDSEERSFVSVEPREIVDAGLDNEKSRLSPDPEKLGLLVSPTRMVIEPRQRKRLRIAAIGPVLPRERVYRVTVKPVTGDVSGTETGLKLLIGYDLLVLVRPPASAPNLEVRRSGGMLTIINQGTASVELAEGKLCDANGGGCQSLPSKRLYAGASWQQDLPLSTGGEYRLRAGDLWTTLRF
jgi:P pilus assembly chaperone PapD